MTQQQIKSLKRLQKDLLKEYTDLVIPYGLSDIPTEVSKVATAKIKSWFEIQDLIKEKGGNISEQSNVRFI